MTSLLPPSIEETNYILQMSFHGFVKRRSALDEIFPQFVLRERRNTVLNSFLERKKSTMYEFFNKKGKKRVFLVYSSRIDESLDFKNQASRFSQIHDHLEMLDLFSPTF